MILNQVIYPQLSVPAETQWESREAVLKWGNECDRRVLDKNDNEAVILLPAFGTEPTKIVRYFFSGEKKP